MFYSHDDNKRYELLLERRKMVKPGDSKLQLGDLFTISFNLATGDRSYLNGIWRVIYAGPQQIYAEAILNVEKVEQPGSMFNVVGTRYMFDIGEYQFYDARELHDLIVAERERSVVVSLCSVGEAQAQPDGTGEAA